MRLDSKKQLTTKRRIDIFLYDKKKHKKMMNKKQCVSHIFILFFLIFVHQTISMLIFGYDVCNSPCPCTNTHTQTSTCVGRFMSISVSAVRKILQLPSPFNLSSFTISHGSSHIFCNCLGFTL